MTSRQLFFTAAGAIRAPWRISFFVGAAIGCFILVGAVLAGPAARLSVGTGLELSLQYWMLVIVLLGAHSIALRWIDRRPWSDVGLAPQNARPVALASGFGIGALAIGLPIAALVALHWVGRAPDAPGPWAPAAARVSFLLVPAALFEELLTRGYVFAVLRQAWGWPPALLVTSIAFGLLHVRNPGATVESTVLVTLAGVFLGAILVATGSLYAAWMGHFAWNWVMAVAFHTAVSGLPMETPNYRYVVTGNGPGWVTGGSWGPEGGAAGGIGMVGGLAYLFTRRRRRGES